MMSDVLSELFFMGGADESSRLSGKKIPRKQANPRVCVGSATNSNGDATATANAAEEKSSESEGNIDNALDKVASDNNSLVGKKKKRELGGNVGGGQCEGEEDEDEEKGEMKGYSRSEVTVIDTSCGVWKTEKLVFRRKNVWKVREKKVKGRSFGRHKRKVVVEEHVGDDVDKKKAKVSVSALDVEAGGDECVALNPIQGQKPQNDTLDNLNDRGVEFGKHLPENKTKDIRKGFASNRSPRNLKKAGSSVILIKGLPTDNKNGGKLHKKILKDSQKTIQSVIEPETGTSFAPERASCRQCNNVI